VPSEPIPTKPSLLPEIRAAITAVRVPGRQTVLMRTDHVDWLLGELERREQVIRHIIAVAQLIDAEEVDVDAMLDGEPS